jgi:hypothetical protein
MASPFEKTMPYKSEHASPLHGFDKKPHLKNIKLILEMDVPTTPRYWHYSRTL